ncbi:MAG TPA: response regulator [Terriglobales bacterium]
MLHHKGLIICIDSDSRRAEGRRLLLEQSGYEVLVATSAKTGLELFALEPADIALVDHELPPMNGVIVTARMKRVKPNVPVVMFVGHHNSPATGGPCSANAIVEEGQPWSMVLEKVDELVRASGPFFQRWLEDWRNRGPAQPQNYRDGEVASIKDAARAH